MKLTAKPIPGKPGFRCTFRHPLHDMKLVCRGLGTTDKNEADAITRDAELIFADADLLKDRHSPRLLVYEPRAVALVFGEEAAASVEKHRVRPTLEESDVGTLAARIITRFEMPATCKADLIELLKGYESRRYKELQDSFKKLEHEIKAMRPRCEEAEARLSDLRRERNEHVKITIGDAVKAWKEFYVEGRAASTIKDATATVESFVASLEKEDSTRLAEVDAEKIDTWLQSLKSEDGEKLSPVTKKKYRAYASTFFTWAQRKYKLSHNPIEGTQPLAGVARNPENILAIRREDELNTFIKALKPFPYWQAWCAVACLAGPRYSEQAWLKVDDVYLEENYLRITSRNSGKRIIGTKTGRERNVPIEKTVLLDILKDHIERRKAEQKSKKATTAEASPWLFPSCVPENTFMPRTKSEPGMWSHGRVFWYAWRKTVRLATGFDPKQLNGDEEEASFDSWLKKQAAYWSFGPAEFRHTFGTVLGRVGWSPLEISHCMGNSPAIAQRFYIVPGTGNKRWSFVY